MKLAVIGGGPSGLYLSILVKRRQPHAQVLVVEQNGADSTFGFGVVLADSGLHRLQAADEQVYQKLIERMTFNDTQNIQVNEIPIELIHPGKGGAIARIDLLRVLQKTAHELGVDVRHGVRIEHPDVLEQLGWGDADVVVEASEEAKGRLFEKPDDLRRGLGAGERVEGITLREIFREEFNATQWEILGRAGEFYLVRSWGLGN